LLFSAATPDLARAAVDAIDTGDTAWVLTSAALVLIMTPALAFFYGGMVGRRNVLATIMQTFIIVAIISVQWVLWGYSLAFGPDKGHFIGGLDWFGFRHVGSTPNPAYASTISHQAYAIFQMMFAIITPALITGVFAGRMRFKPFLLFIILWSTLVYDPIAHWVWGTGGWLREWGALDFAGGTVVHISSGMAALAAALTLKRRYPRFESDAEAPHDIPMVVLGAALLWFGWFGFNAGSAVTSGALAASAFLATNTAAAMSALVWMTMTWWFGGKPSVIGAAAGAVAGLVAITPASGYVGPMAAIIIGLGSGVFCYLACRVRARVGLKDELDVWGVHGVGGIWGALATGLLASAAINVAGADGLIYGNAHQFGVQTIAVACSAAYSFVVTAVILKLIGVFMPTDVAEHEEAGLDWALHGEAAYQT